MAESLAFDWGTTIVGVLDIENDKYVPYRHENMLEGADRVRRCRGSVVSFNGCGRDLAELAKLLGVESLCLHAKHDDMQLIISAEKWPPKSGTSPILGPNLNDTYSYYFGVEPLVPPPELTDEYEIHNWRDCFKTAQLWKRWKDGLLGSLESAA